MLKPKNKGKYHKVSFERTQPNDSSRFLTTCASIMAVISSALLKTHTRRLFTTHSLGNPVLKPRQCVQRRENNN